MPISERLQIYELFLKFCLLCKKSLGRREKAFSSCFFASGNQEDHRAAQFVFHAGDGVDPVERGLGFVQSGQFKSVLQQGVYVVGDSPVVFDHFFAEKYGFSCALRKVAVYGPMEGASFSS